MKKTKYLLVPVVILTFFFLNQTIAFADVANEPTEVEGVSILPVGIIVAFIALISFFIIRSIIKKKKA